MRGNRTVRLGCQMDTRPRALSTRSEFSWRPIITSKEVMKLFTRLRNEGPLAYFWHLV